MILLDCTVRYDTGRMVCFRTSQLPRLPKKSCDIILVLPDRPLCPCHFNRNVNHPNITGEKLVKFIRKNVDYKRTFVCTIDITDHAIWYLYPSKMEVSMMAWRDQCDTLTEAISLITAGRPDLRKKVQDYLKAHT